MSDLIRREDAIEAVIAEGRNVHTSEYANAERIIYEADAVEALAMLPSAEPKTGEWVEDGSIEKCNQCGEPRDFPHRKYCPNCGTRMCKGGGEE